MTSFCWLHPQYRESVTLQVCHTWQCCDNRDPDGRHFQVQQVRGPTASFWATPYASVVTRVIHLGDATVDGAGTWHAWTGPSLSLALALAVRNPWIHWSFGFTCGMGKNPGIWWQFMAYLWSVGHSQIELNLLGILNTLHWCYMMLYLSRILWIFCIDRRC